MKQDNIETIVLVFCIVVLIFLTIKISIDSTNYSCDKCIVSLSNSLELGTFNKFYEEPVTKLIESYKNGTCIYTWDPNQGYIKSGS